MEAVMRSNNMNAHKQLSSFVSLGENDEMTQLILEELSLPRYSFMNVAADMAVSPSSKKELGLNSIKEDGQEMDE